MAILIFNNILRNTALISSYNRRISSLGCGNPQSFTDVNSCEFSSPALTCSYLERIIVLSQSNYKATYVKAQPCERISWRGLTDFAREKHSSTCVKRHA